MMAGWKIIVACLFGANLLTGQPSSYFFHALDQGHGLNEGTIRSIGQDKYGYIWIGTTSGLNRFNGYEITNFIHDDANPGSVTGGQITAIACHPDGSLWFGGENGLMEYQYENGLFNQVPDSTHFRTNKIIANGEAGLFVATHEGLAELDPKSKKLSWFGKDISLPDDSLLTTYISDMALMNGHLLMTTRYGLVDYQPASKKITLLLHPRLQQIQLNNVTMSRTGTIWLSSHGSPQLIRTDLQLRDIKIFPYLFPEVASNLSNSIPDIMVDHTDRLWATTAMDGICYYDEKTEQFHRILNDPLRTGSPVANHLGQMFQGQYGFIWIATEGYGVNYFHPEHQLFAHLLPQTNQHSAWSWMWGRAMAEDHEGGLWMGTGEGVVYYNPVTNETRSIKNVAGQPNQLYFNSIRGVGTDEQYVWIATGRGVNRYSFASKKMEFITPDQGVPMGFYFYLYKDSRGRIWFCTRDHDGLYYYDPADKGFHGISQHPGLSFISGIGVRSMMEDRKGRLWLGLNGSGLAMYDPNTGSQEHWKRSDTDTASLCHDLVTSLAEDKQGLIWISGFGGLTSYNPETKRFQRYTQRNGLPNHKTSCLMVDEDNRVWIGMTQGLAVLDATRKHFTTFDIKDGLPAYEFADMPATRLRDGRFAMPTMRGFVLFDPEAFQPRATTLTCYISSFRFDNQKNSIVANPEELTALTLRPQQNYFSITITSPHFRNPGQVWYSYKLEGFDQQWQITKNRNISYTNVPGGTYTFRYKASIDNSQWDVPEKTLKICIRTIYYQTWWFWSLIMGLAGFLLFNYFRFRFNKQSEILELQAKATTLEKEKTQIQYENLKQQLNPHFLFNSLTSLRSLIRIDQKLATQFLDGLSKTYRYLLRSGDTELVPLEDELNFVQTFVQLQKTRFEEGLQVVITVPDADKQKMIAPVTLQNLLENAIKHNMTSVDNPLQVEIFTSDDYVIVRNHLQRYRHVDTSNKRGLASMTSLYRFLTSQPVIIHEDEQFFTVKIPLL